MAAYLSESMASARYARGMQASADVSLLPGEWAVLGVLAQAPAHGFAVARQLAAGESIGRVWTMGRPRVYRAIADLAAAGLVEPVGEAPSERGPARAVYAASRSGRLALDGWLATPVAHVRDVRSELLLKLVLLDAAGRSPRPLLEAQRERLAPVLASLEGVGTDRSCGFDAVLARYRLATARGVIAFIDDLLGSTPPSPSRPPANSASPRAWT